MRQKLKFDVVLEKMDSLYLAEEGRVSVFHQQTDMVHYILLDTYYISFLYIYRRNENMRTQNNFSAKKLLFVP